jgi:SAM-dependent methyltransferase
MTNALHATRGAVNALLRPLGLQIIRGRSGEGAVQTFLPARRTVSAAKQAGMSLGDYIDANYAEAGATTTTVGAMLALADLPDGVSRVCEIGAGSGRYIEPIAEALHPETYEVYEPAQDWARYLRGLPGVTVHPTDGRSLRSTDGGSCDLVHAQKVFVYLDFATTVGYLEEMVRVVKVGGVVAFDVVTENCLDDVTVARWAAEGSVFRPVPRAWLLS